MNKEINLYDGSTIIRTEERIYFRKVGKMPPILDDPSKVADDLLYYIEFLNDVIESLFQIIQRGEMTYYDLREAEQIYNKVSKLNQI